MDLAWHHLMIESDGHNTLHDVFDYGIAQFIFEYRSVMKMIKEVPVGFFGNDSIFPWRYFLERNWREAILGGVSF